MKIWWKNYEQHLWWQQKMTKVRIKRSSFDGSIAGKSDTTIIDAYVPMSIESYLRPTMRSWSEHHKSWQIERPFYSVTKRKVRKNILQSEQRFSYILFVENAKGPTLRRIVGINNGLNYPTRLMGVLYATNRNILEHIRTYLHTWFHLNETR